MKIDQIDVRAEIQLARAKLAHRKNAEAADLARALAKKTNRETERDADTFVRQLRHCSRRLRDADSIEQVGNRDPCPHAAHESAQLRCAALTIGRVENAIIVLHRSEKIVHGRSARI